MNRIKIIGGIVFLLSIVLAWYSSFIAEQNRINSTTMVLISEQKAFTQEISKSIFYIYRNGESSLEILDETLKKYLENSKVNEMAFTQNRFVSTLWNLFYADVEKFRDQQAITTGYNSVISSKLVNRIYRNNLLLVDQFNQLMQVKQKEYHREEERYKWIQYLLFIILLSLLIYLFTQIHVIIEFIQKFRNTSQKIIENATIEGLEPITIEEGDSDLTKATENYNHLISKIDFSIKNSTQAMNQTTKSLEEVARNIEDFMELLSLMQEDESDMIFEKEDAVIDSLENLMRLRKELKYLQKDLDNLISKK